MNRAQKRLVTRPEERSSYSVSGDKAILAAQKKAHGQKGADRGYRYYKNALSCDA